MYRATSNIPWHLLLTGYQAEGTSWRNNQTYGPRKGYVELDGRCYMINACVYQLNGYSAHTERVSMIGFVKGMRIKSKEIRLIHGDRVAKHGLQDLLGKLFTEINVRTP